MTEEEIGQILEGDSDYKGTTPCRIFKGLEIIKKHLDPNTTLIEGAAHDEIYSVELSTLAESTITKEDVEELCRLGWREDDTGTGLAHFV